MKRSVLMDSSHVPKSSWSDDQEFPDSWSQLLLGGSFEEEDNMQEANKKLENFAEQYGKLENSSTNSFNDMNVEFQQIMPTFSTKSSCVTSSSSNFLDYSTKFDAIRPPPDHSSECNSMASGSSAKKAKVKTSSTQSTFKVRKEKLGDRITALHQIVSPFGKTDTASVLLEAIDYIRFLQNQIEALSSPYLVNESGNMKKKHQWSLTDYSDEEAKKDLSSRGLCLVPISCTLQVETDNGADYYAPGLL